MQPHQVTSATRSLFRMLCGLAALGVCIGGCTDSTANRPAQVKTASRPSSPDLVLAVEDGGSSHPSHFRLSRPSFAIFEDGTVIRASDFPESTKGFQTLRLDPEVVSAFRASFRRLEASARGKQFMGPDMSSLTIAGMSGGSPPEWVRLEFAKGFADFRDKTVVPDESVSLLRGIVADVNALKWAEASEASQSEVKRVESMK